MQRRRRTARVRSALVARGGDRRELRGVRLAVLAAPQLRVLQRVVARRVGGVQQLELRLGLPESRGPALVARVFALRQEDIAGGAALLVLAHAHHPLARRGEQVREAVVERGAWRRQSGERVAAARQVAHALTREQRRRRARRLLLHELVVCAAQRPLQLRHVRRVRAQRRRVRRRARDGRERAIVRQLALLAA